MKHTKFAAAFAVLLASPALAAGQDPAADAAAAERAAMLREIESLRARVTALEAEKTRPPVQTSPSMPGGSKLARDHNLELYGFVQLDAIQDFKRVNPDWDATLRPSRIPTDWARSAATASRSSASASPASGPRRPASFKAGPMRRSSSSTSTAPASTRARRRSTSATCMRAGGRSLSARPTPCGWTPTSTPMSSITGARRGW